MRQPCAGSPFWSWSASPITRSPALIAAAPRSRQPHVRALLGAWRFGQHDKRTRAQQRNVAGHGVDGPGRAGRHVEQQLQVRHGLPYLFRTAHPERAHRERFGQQPRHVGGHHVDRRELEAKDAPILLERQRAGRHRALACAERVVDLRLHHVIHPGPRARCSPAGRAAAIGSRAEPQDARAEAGRARRRAARSTTGWPSPAARSRRRRCRDRRRAASRTASPPRGRAPAAPRACWLRGSACRQRASPRAYAPVPVRETRCQAAAPPGTRRGDPTTSARGTDTESKTVRMGPGRLTLLLRLRLRTAFRSAARGLRTRALLLRRGRGGGCGAARDAARLGAARHVRAVRLDGRGQARRWGGGWRRAATRGARRDRKRGRRSVRRRQRDEVDLRFARR